MPINLQDYHSRFNPAQGYVQHLFRSGYALQDAELNELQQTGLHALSQLGNTLYQDGEVLAGAAMVVDIGAGNVTINSGQVWILGLVRTLAGRTFAAPMDAVVELGVWLDETIVTELEDPALRDPALGTQNYDLPGSARLKAMAQWGWSGEGLAGVFFPVRTMGHGQLVTVEPPPASNPINVAIARYDVDNNGDSYVTEGLKVGFLGFQPGLQIYEVREGRARINGFEMRLLHALRLPVPHDPPIKRITSEPSLFTPDGNGAMHIDFRHTPVGSIVRIDANKQTSVTMTHGGSSGCTDPLPDTGVLTIVSVQQGATTYQSGSDFIMAGDALDWSPAGSEPAPGSSYAVTYQYRTQIQADTADETGFTVSGLVTGSLVEVDYDLLLPRIDIIALSPGGEVIRIKGVPSQTRPVAPVMPRGLLGLATVTQTWRFGHAPTVVNDALYAVRLSEFLRVQKNMDTLSQQVASLYLLVNAAATDPAAKLGMFVDPFLDDDMRDAGVTQTAAIVDGELVLPVNATVVDLSLANAINTLTYTTEAVIEQTSHYTSSLINPYLVFTPLPAVVTLNPACDRWTDVVTTFASPTTQRIYVKGAIYGNNWTEQVSNDSWSGGTELVGSASDEQATLRQRSVAFTVTGFAANEQLASVTIDGVAVTTSPGSITANISGELSGSFTIPAGIPSGTREVVFTGTGGTVGRASYTGEWTIQTDTYQQVTVQAISLCKSGADPLAQTFTLSEGRLLCGVELWFAVKGNKEVRVQIRTCENGLPTSNVLVQGKISLNSIVTNSSTLVTWDPLWVAANEEHALVILTDDKAHSLYYAEGGKGSAASNPYTVGVMLDSSNGSTWTAYQSKDLKFKLLAASASSTSRTISLGSFEASGVTDFLVLAGVNLPESDTAVTFEITPTGHEVITVQEGQVASLDAGVSGTVTVSATLTGTSKHLPVLYRDLQLVAGVVSPTGTYVSRAITAGSNVKVTITLDAFLPGSSTLGVELKQGENWLPITLTSSQAVGDGWNEMAYVVTGFTAETTRLRLTLNGSAAHRPKARALRLIVT